MSYSILQIIRLGIFKVRTFFVFPNAKIIRFPIDIRGRKFMQVGDGFTTGFGCRLEAYPADKSSVVLRIGKNFQMNDYVHIAALEEVIIGDNVLMASKIFITDISHGTYTGDEKNSHPESIPKERALQSKPVRIGDNVWLGELVSVLPGVTIGKGTIVGANSVVSKSLPENIIAVGSPAKPVKKFNLDKMVWERIEQNSSL
ncbi:MAG: acetyltransferase [Weeksellaceae bacterium]|nr:acetyltransferase [Weeksellaceae bacterium]